MTGLLNNNNGCLISFRSFTSKTTHIYITGTLSFSSSGQFFSGYAWTIYVDLLQNVNKLMAATNFKTDDCIWHAVPA